MRTLLFCLLLLSSGYLPAQQAIRQVIGSLGGSSSANGTTLSFTVGEAQVGGHTSNNHSLLKGFQQPIQLITPQRLGQMPSPRAQQFLLSELYPNPATDQAFLHYQAEGASVSIQNMKGQVLWSQKLTQEQGIVRLPVHKLAAGMYIVMLANAHTQKPHKLIISK